MPRDLVSRSAKEIARQLPTTLRAALIGTAASLCFASVSPSAGESSQLGLQQGSESSTTWISSDLRCTFASSRASGSRECPEKNLAFLRAWPYLNGTDLDRVIDGVLACLGC